MTHPLEIEKVIKAPTQKVWKAITDKDEMKHWYFPLSDFKLNQDMNSGLKEEKILNTSLPMYVRSQK